MSAFELQVTLDDLILATGAEVVRGAFAWTVLMGVTTDSRKIPERGLFIGLAGEKFDGSDYGAQALQQGAAAVLVSRAKAPLALENTQGAVLAVDDTTRALGLLARWHRRRMPAKVVAVTGSSGKTTTKEMLAAILRERGAVLATEGNLNNEIGAPLTVLGLREHHEFAVIEIGMNHEGEIGRLTAMLEPDVGVVTNAAAVHVEALGSVENVSRAKGELYQGMPLSSWAIVNADDTLMSTRAKWAGRRSATFGRAGTYARLEQIVSHDANGVKIKAIVNGAPLDVQLPVVGVHNALNACAAMAAAGVLGVPTSAMVAGLAKARPPGRRLRLSPIPHAHATLLDDCYNANPASTVAAVETLCELAPEGHRIAVLGDMRELGTHEEEGHRTAGKAAGKAKLKLLVAFGPASRFLAEEAVKAGLSPDRILHTEDPGAAAERVRAALGTQDVVLVKASRGTRLERVSDLLVPPENPGEKH